MLEIGTATGYNAACLAALDARVVSIEERIWLDSFDNVIEASGK